MTRDVIFSWFVRSMQPVVRGPSRSRVPTPPAFRESCALEFSGRPKSRPNRPSSVLTPNAPAFRRRRFPVPRACPDPRHIGGAALRNVALLRLHFLLRFLAERREIRFQICQPAVHFRHLRFGLFAHTRGFDNLLADLLRSRGEKRIAVFPVPDSPIPPTRMAKFTHSRIDSRVGLRWDLVSLVALSRAASCAYRRRGNHQSGQQQRGQHPALHAACRRRIDSAI